MDETPKQGGYIGQAWLVIVLALIYGAALAGVQTTLGPIIELNKRNETYQRIPELVGMSVPLSEAEKQRLAIEEETVEDDDGRQRRVYQAYYDGALRGWVLPAGGQGFADRIDVLIGLDAQLSSITGLYVLDQKETPGLGDKITTTAFRSHFADQPVEPPLVVVKPSQRADAEAKIEGEIVAITGATISSESVAAIVNRTVADLRQPIHEKFLSGAGEPPAAEPPEKQ